MTRTWTWISPGPEATERLGSVLGENAWGGLVIALEGDLGAGKTCLARGVARGLGVPPDIPVVSPTFTLINPYEGRLPLYHCDLYRLIDPEELEVIGLHDLFGSDSVVVVEWADRFPEILPGTRVTIQLEVGHGDERQVRVTCPGEDAREENLMAALAGFALSAPCAERRKRQAV